MSDQMELDIQSQISKRVICFYPECQNRQMLKTEETSKQCNLIHPSFLFNLGDIFNASTNQSTQLKIDICKQVASDINKIKIKLCQAENLLNEVFFFQKLPELMQNQDPMLFLNQLQLHTKIIIEKEYRTILFYDQVSQITKLIKQMELLKSEFKKLCSSLSSEKSILETNIDKLVFHKDDFPFEFSPNTTLNSDNESTQSHSTIKTPLPIKKSIEKQTNSSKNKNDSRMKYPSTSANYYEQECNNKEPSPNFSLNKMSEKVPTENIIQENNQPNYENQQGQFFPPLNNNKFEINAPQSQIQPPIYQQSEQPPFIEYPNIPNDPLLFLSQNQTNSLNLCESLKILKPSQDNQMQSEIMNLPLTTEVEQSTFQNKQVIPSQPDYIIIIDSPIHSATSIEMVPQIIQPQQSDFNLSPTQIKNGFQCIHLPQQENEIISSDTNYENDSLNNLFYIPQLKAVNYFDNQQFENNKAISSNIETEDIFLQFPQSINQNSSKISSPSKDIKTANDLYHQEYNEQIPSSSNNQLVQKNSDKEQNSEKEQLIEQKIEKKKQNQNIQRSNNIMHTQFQDKGRQNNHLIKKQLVHASNSLVVIYEQESKSAKIYFSLGIKRNNKEEWDLSSKFKPIKNIKKIECKQMGKYHYLIVLKQNGELVIFLIDSQQQDLVLLSYKLLEIADFTCGVCIDSQIVLCILVIEFNEKCNINLLIQCENGELKKEKFSRTLKFEQKCSISDSMDSFEDEFGDIFNVLLLLDKNNPCIISYSPSTNLYNQIQFDCNVGRRAYTASNNSIFCVGVQKLDLIEKNKVGDQITRKINFCFSQGEILKVGMYQNNIIIFQEKGISLLMPPNESKLLESQRIESYFLLKEQLCIFALTIENSLKAYNMVMN